MTTFGTLLRNRRKACHDPATSRSLSQEQLVYHLNASIGLEYARVSVSQWESDKHKIHHSDRGLLIGLIRVLHDYGGVKDVAAANELLFAGDYRDLNEEELRSINSEWEMPLKATTLPTPAVQLATLPARPQIFVDVSAEIRTLINMFEAGTTIVGLIGVAGSGKTVLAVEAAQQLIKQGRFQRVVRLLLHTDVAMVETVTEQLALRIFGRIDSDYEMTKHAVQTYLRQQAYFIVIEGAETISPSLWETLSQWSQPSCFLVTDRRRPASQSIPIYTPEVWTNEVALSYVRRLTVLQQIKQEMDDSLLRELCILVGNNPKALQLIPSFAARRSAEQLRFSIQYSHDLTDLYTEMTANVWAVLDQSARSLLITLCLVTEDGADEELLRTVSGLTRRQFWQALETLEKYVFVVSHGEQPGWYYTHRLIAQFVQTQDDTLLASTATAMLDYWQQRFNQLPVSDWHMLVPFRTNIFQATSVSIDVGGDGTQLLPLLSTILQFAERYGFTHALQTILVYALVTLLLNPDHEIALLILLGKTQRLNFAWELAEETLQKAIVLAEQGGDKTQLAKATWELASVLKGQGEFDSAETLLKRAINLFDQLSDQTGTGKCNNLLGLIAYERRDLNQAESHLGMAIADLHTRDRANAHANYAAMLQSQSRFASAHEQYAAARAIYTKEGTSLDLSRLDISEASLYAKQGDLEKAEALFAAINIDTVPNVRMQAFYWWNFGLLAADRGEWQEARERMEKSIGAWRSVEDTKRLARAERKLSQIIAEQRK